MNVSSSRYKVFSFKTQKFSEVFLFLQRLFVFLIYSIKIIQHLVENCGFVR